MRIYTIYEPNDKIPSIVPIKEGFNWFAFIFPLPWALLNSLWLVALTFLMIYFFLGWLLIVFGGNYVAQTIAFSGLALAIGWMANDLKRSNLIKRGYKEDAILLADSKESAISRYVTIKSDQNIEKPRNRGGGPW